MIYESDVNVHFSTPFPNIPRSTTVVDALLASLANAPRGAVHPHGLGQEGLGGGRETLEPRLEKKTTRGQNTPASVKTRLTGGLGAKTILEKSGGHL